MRRSTAPSESSGTSSTGARSTVPPCNLCLLRRARAGERGGPQLRGRGSQARARPGEPRSARLDREPCDLLHGRERLPGGRGAVVSGRARMTLTIPAPEQEPERKEGGERQVRRERDLACLSPSTTVGPVAEKAPVPSAPRADLALRVDRPSVDAASRRASGARTDRARTAARDAPRVDRLVLAPELDEDDVDRGSREAARQARVRTERSRRP